MLAPITFTPITPLDYVLAHIVLAQIGIKQTPISAIRGTPGEEVITYTSGGFYETSNKVGVDPVTKLADWIVTQQTGEKMIITDAKFNELYFKPNPSDKTNIWYPKGGKRGLIKLEEDVSFDAPWNEKQYVKKGGYLVVVDKGNIYGIQKEEFEKSYKIVEGNGEKLINKLLNKESN